MVTRDAYGDSHDGERTRQQGVVSHYTCTCPVRVKGCGVSSVVRARETRFRANTQMRHLELPSMRLLYEPAQKAQSMSRRSTKL
jgi:hypothetical protein